jgi:tetratricopeptide (TPR) repeat protein
VSTEAVHKPRIVGRERELLELEEALEDARLGHGSLFLLVGEAGIGKTRLTQAVAARAETAGQLVLWGRCWEEGGAPPYWPWVQVLRACLRAQARGAFPESLPSAAPIEALASELTTPGGGDLALQPGSSERARFALFDAVSMFLRDAAEVKPLVLAFDDLHWADEPSLLLLEFVARELPSAHILLIGNHRPLRGSTAATEAAVARTLGRIGDTARRLPLGGLNETELTRLVADRTGGEVAEDVALALFETTAGHPLFVDEVVRLLEHEGRLERFTRGRVEDFRLPEGVREAVSQRLGLLPDEAGDLLRTASVLGLEIPLATLERICDLPRERLVELLGEAVAAGVLTEAGGGTGVYTFRHTMLRQALYDALSVPERMERHTRTGEVLEELYGSERDLHLAELAHHFAQAGPSSREKAIGYAIRAGDRALASLAYEEAANQYERALATLDAGRTGHGIQRCEIMLKLGNAQRLGGESERARATFDAALEAAESVGSPVHVAEAVLGLAGRYWTAGAADELLVAQLERALRGLGDEGSPLRTRVLARLATELTLSSDQRRVETLSGEALEVARRSGDSAALAVALDARLAAVWRPDNLDERLGLAQEFEGLAESCGDTETALRGRVFSITCLLEAGDVTRADIEIARAAKLAEQLRQPLFMWHTRVLRALRVLFDGRPDVAERLAEQALAAGQRAQEANAVYLHRSQLAMIRRDQGRLDEFEGVGREMTERFAAVPAWRAGLAMLYIELGRDADATLEVERLGAEGLSAIPFDSRWLHTICLWAEVFAHLGEADLADEAYALLEPYAGRNVMPGRVASHSIGSARRYLGLAARAARRFDVAIAHLDEAIAHNAHMGGRAWVARSQLDCASALVERDAPGDQERARELLTSAETTMHQLALSGLQRQAAGVRTRLEDVPVSEPAPTPVLRAEPQRGCFKRDGDYWTVGLGHATIMLKDTKGMRYLARLIAAPDVEIHALDLVGGEVRAPAPQRADGEQLESRSAGSDDAGPMLDEQAKRAYRARLEEIREEIAEADSFNDVERSARAREEMEMIAQELSAAVGLGGRDRRASSTSERARVNVTRAIRSAVARIAEDDPALGRYFDTTVRTGTFCSYRPDPDRSISWEL